MPERKAPTGTITGKAVMRTDWETPPRLLDAVRAYFGEDQIPFDAATKPTNPTGAARFACPEATPPAGGGLWWGDGLKDAWPPRAWVNPPYGKVIREWLAKIEAEARRGVEIVALLPCARWEQAYLTGPLRAANAVCFIRKRVRFINPATGDAVNGNPYANMFVGWGVTPWRFRASFGDLGACFRLEAL